MLQLKPEGLDLADVASRPVSVGGRQLIADKSGALYWPGEQALVVADLTLAGGHGAGARQILTALAEVMDRFEPARVIVLGEGLSVDPRAAAISAEDLQILRILQEDRAWTWVTGDAGRPTSPELGGSACGELEVGGIALRARPTPGWATHEIAASMRPAAHLLMYGYSLRRACFVGNRHRLLMPAFGAPSGGTNVLDAAFRPLLGDGMSVSMLGQEGLYPVATRLLAED
jgi:metallophosphoesterase superfamily enzyme